MKKINVCFHIGNISNCGGTENVTTQISNLLLDNYDKYNVTILSSYYDVESGPFFKGNEKIKYDRLFDKKMSFKKNYFKVINQLKKYIVENNIDVLIGVDTILSLFDIPAIKGTKCKYIAWEHFNFNYNLGVKLRDIGRRYAVKKASALVVLTDRDKNYFEKNLKIKCELKRIYNPFIFKNIQEKYIPNNKTIVSAGRLTSQKGFDILLEVAKKIKDKNVDFKWIILGDGEDKNLLEAKIIEYGLSKNVELKGKVKDVNSFYKESRMFVLTSRFEGLGLVVLEAKMNCLPVISFDCDCGPSEMIKDSINGYLIKPFDVEEMSNKIIELLENDDKCIKFSNNAKLEIEKFDPKNIINEWDNLISEVISK